MQVSEETKAAAAAWVRRWGRGQIGREPHLVKAFALAGDVPTIDVVFVWGITSEHDQERGAALFRRVINYATQCTRPPGRGVAELIDGDLWVVSFYGELIAGMPRFKAQFSKWTPCVCSSFVRCQQLGDVLDPVQLTLAVAERKRATPLEYAIGVRDV